MPSNSKHSKTLSGFIFYRLLDYSHAGSKRNKIDLKLDALADLAIFVKVHVEKEKKEGIQEIQQDIDKQRKLYQYEVDGNEYGIEVRNEFDIKCSVIIEKLFQIIYDEGLFDSRFLQTVDWASISIGTEGES